MFFRFFQYFLIFCILLSFRSIASATDIPVKPMDITILEFDKPVKDIPMTSLVGLSIQNKSTDSKGFLLVTPSESFMTGTAKIVFQDTSILAVNFYPDPTAKPVQKIETPNSATPSLPGLPTTTTSTAAVAKSPYTIPEPPSGSKDILVFLNSLTTAEKTRLRYSRSVPNGTTAMITRFLELDGSTKLAYELELANVSTKTLLISAKMFSSPVTEAVAIIGMDQYGRYTLGPMSKVFIYIVDVKVD